ncbi:UDP-N-acetylglucosamine 2-epimerase (non-hydrolyzing) [Thalassospira sp. GB04J01]|uniref:non-hydrolyzing UDP-N-acetylglucosamine 2-epimerase n=1 Tax=Thalassospira sp. GB04J01 TaxID=1485225 RepID=UPI000C9A73F2|nr:UDP-N-acetylglucosamine 2-epimerase (non-hydrolyzing) [Thalassospira sp. GB04J01]|tara:strand:- start:161 stop:1333 length:1173 start_codon:yes stop_codon:yes gene_type:complete
MNKIAIIAGTRPELIKLAPVVRALHILVGKNNVTFYCTGQHRKLLDQAVDSLNIHVNIDFKLMTNTQSSGDIHKRVLTVLEKEFAQNRPEILIVQGDTASAFAGAMSGFLLNIPVVHVEAGLRTHDLTNPWPEEGLRQMIARITSLHLAPTDQAKDNLVKEGIHSDKIHVVGNPGIDSLVLARQEPNAQLLLKPVKGGSKEKLILITMHRREALDGHLDQFCVELAKTIKQHSDNRFVWPLHPNPKVRETVRRHFPEGDKHLNLQLIEPLPYQEMITMLDFADLVISDSGGMQEEAPYCGVPIIVVRDVTERPEIIDLGLGCLIGSQAKNLSEAVTNHLSVRPQPSATEKWQKIQGHGKAADRIAEHIVNFVNQSQTSACKHNKHRHKTE